MISGCAAIAFEDTSDAGFQFIVGIARREV